MSFLSPLIVKTAAALDRRFGWDRLPRFLGVYTVAGIRTRLRHENLYDTETVMRRLHRRAACRRATCAPARWTAPTTT